MAKAVGRVRTNTRSPGDVDLPTSPAAQNRRRLQHRASAQAEVCVVPRAMDFAATPPGLRPARRNAQAPSTAQAIVEPPAIPAHHRHGRRARHRHLHAKRHAIAQVGTGAIASCAMVRLHASSHALMRHGAKRFPRHRRTLRNLARIGARPCVSRTKGNRCSTFLSRARPETARCEHRRRPRRAPSRDASRGRGCPGQRPALRAGTCATPARVVRACVNGSAATRWTERILGRTFDGAGCDDIVLLRDIPLRSVCEHHMAPITRRGACRPMPPERVVGIPSWRG